MQNLNRPTLSLKTLEVPKRSSIWQHKEKGHTVTVTETTQDERNQIWVAYQWGNSPVMSNDKSNRDFQNTFVKISDFGGIILADTIE